MNSKTFILIQTFVNFLLIKDSACNSVPKKVSNDINSSDRIFFGIEANSADFPFLMRLEKGGRRCGASSIAKYYLITAARCISGLKCSSIKIFPSNWMESSRKTRFHAAKCYIHKKYRKSKLAYDIALIKTMENLFDDGEIKPIPLPTTETFYTFGTRGVIAGWGMTSPDGFYPKYPIRGNVSVENWDTCNKQYKKIRPLCSSNETNFCSLKNINVPKRILCTRGRGSKPPRICKGDSGGPVVIHSVLAAIVLESINNGTECGIVTPSIHTSVADFLPWIYSVIEPDRDTSKYEVNEEHFFQRRSST